MSVVAKIKMPGIPLKEQKVVIPGNIMMSIGLNGLTCIIIPLNNRRMLVTRCRSLAIPGGSSRMGPVCIFERSSRLDGVVGPYQPMAPSPNLRNRFSTGAACAIPAQARPSRHDHAVGCPENTDGIAASNLP